MKFSKKIITIFLAVVLCASSVLAEMSSHSQTAKGQQEGIIVISGNGKIKRVNKEIQLAQNTQLQPGDTISTDKTGLADISFLADGRFRLAAETTVKIVEMDDKAMLLVLQQGRIWVNSQFISQPINVQAGNIILSPQKAAFDLSFDGDKGSLLLAKNQATVSLLNSTDVLPKVINFDDNRVINHFLVTENSQITFAASTISSQSDALKKLLYSKLVKEFQYGLVDENHWQSDQWLATNIAIDEKLSKQKSQDLLQNIRQGSLHYNSLDAFGYQFDSALNRFASVLTFSDDKNEERAIDAIFAQLDDAKHLLVYGRNSEAQDRLSFFKQSVVDFIQQKPVFRPTIIEKMKQSYKVIADVLPDDPLYQAKTTLQESLLAGLGSTQEDFVTKLGLLRDMVEDVSEIATSDAPTARLVFDQYFKKLNDFFSKEKNNLTINKYLLAEENQVIDNIFKRFSEFYQDSFFAQKYNLERQWLSLLPEGGTKNEERQTIISTKIDFLKQLQYFFLNQKISLDDARKIALRLISEIKDLEPSDDVGVKELFALRLKDYGQFLRFLNATDVNSFQNSSPQKRYDEFLAAQKEEVSIEQAVDEFLGNQTQSKPSVDQILANAHSEFEAAGITNVTFGDFNSADQQTLPVKNAVYQNIAFSADYDWDRKLISNIKIGDEVKSQSAIHLENLGQVLVGNTTQTQETQVRIPRVPRVAADTTQQTIQTSETIKTERVTKILLIQKLKTFDISATEDNIIIVDKTAGIFTIRDASIISNAKIIFDFRVNIKENKVDLITLKTTPEKNLQQTFTLAELSAKLKSIQ